jgi:hypothetical protein
MSGPPLPPVGGGGGLGGWEGGSRDLRRAFRFEAADLRANRAGRLSPRQAALLGAGRTAMRLALAVFAVVMLGTLGLIGFTTWPLSGGLGLGGGESTVGLAVVVAVVLIVIVAGALQALPHLRAAGSRRISVATGRMAVVSAADDGYHVQIGSSRLRLASAEQLDAFAPGTEYRVHYLAAPVALVLSAEALGGAADRGEATATADAEAATLAGDQITVVRRGSVVVVLLGVLALGIPIAGIAGGALPERLRPVLWIGLFAVAVGFAWFAVWWLSPRRPGPSDPGRVRPRS